jgi:histidine triad (HIT) family protein
VTLPDDYAGEDFYCDVALRHVDDLDVVHADEHVLAFRHTRPFYDVHVVVVPKRHIASLTAATADDEEDLRALFVTIRNVTAQIEREHDVPGGSPTSAPTRTRSTSTCTW